MSAKTLAAQTLESQASEIAALACSDLLATHRDIGERFGENAEQMWSDHLRQRLLELAASLAANDHSVFTSGLAWSRSAMQARGLTIADLDKGISALRTALKHRLADEQLSAALTLIEDASRMLEKGSPEQLDSALDAGVPLDRLALQYVQAVVAGNVQPGMQLILDAVANGASVRDAYLKVLLPAQQEVGRLWHLNKLSVSEEHLVSYTTQRLMARLSGMADFKSDNGYTVVAGAVAGNIHDIGIRAISYLLEIEGWRTIYLGSDIPRVELPTTLATYDADVLMLSVALTSQLQATTRAIKTIREDGYPVKILVGGNGIPADSELWKDIGADGYADNADTALEKALELASTP